ncbi:MAG: DUF882 domain-containing protein [Pseudolabrys sp.]|nr:DUF882 domain-containing protein [Pseudolabrys sp.]
MQVRNAHERSLFVNFAARLSRGTALAAVLLLAANTGLQNAAAEGDTRTLSFHHVHTGEDITITFKRNGQYDEAALTKLNWFMRDWRKEQDTRMDPQLFDLLWEAYREAGATQPIQVICGFRSAGTNDMLRGRSRSSGVAKDSLHTQGDAMDFYIPGVPLEKIREIGLRMQRGGVGFYPTSGSPFVHLDTGNVRHWPRMSHDQLVKVFPDQRTVHVPSDGQPLAGYALALADLERDGRAPNAVSLAAARSAGVISEEDEATATAATPKKRSLFASLFGSKDKTEEPAEAAPAPKQVAAKPSKPALRETIAVAQMPLEPPAPAPVAVATQRIVPDQTVPMPKLRPAQAIQVAAATALPRPRPAAALAHSPINQRGLWPLEVASADASPTAALAYANADAATASNAAPKSVPMGAATTGSAPANDTIADAGGMKTDRLAVAFAQRFEGMQGPWLRAMILTPSITTAMSTTRLGALDTQPITQYMKKPASALVMTFADDPHYGMETGKFSGSAVVFLATATFVPQRTAFLAQ